MKKQLILGSFLALTSIVCGQWNNPAAPADITSTQKVGVNLPTSVLPMFPIPSSTGLGPASQKFAFTVAAKQNYDGLMFYTDASVTSGNIGIKLNNRTFASSTNKGTEWGIYSLGLGDAAGAGNFAIYDSNMPTSGSSYFLIKHYDGITGSGSQSGFVGINENNPQNRLQIRSGTANTSGLRFSNLTSAATPVTNPGSGVLSLDASGDVIYVNAPGGSAGGASLGNYCSSTTGNPLTGHYQIPMNNFNFNFTTPAGSKSQVLIGNPGCSSTLARLDVYDDNQGTGIQGYCSTPSQNNIGIRGIGADQGTSMNITTFGVMGEVGPRNPQNMSAGVAGFCGGPAAIASLPIGQDIGVYGNSISNNGTWAGYFDGDVNVNGVGWYYATTLWSDKRFKKDITKIENVTSKIKSLNAYDYYFRTGEFKNKNFDDKKHIGFIAQELKEVFPELVKESKDGFYGVDYQGMIPILLEGFKEQQTQIETQQKQIDEQKQLINQLLQKAATPTGLDQHSLGAAGYAMEQNQPNPFNGVTTVKYTLPATVVNAYMAVYDLSGKQIASFPITEKGSSSINITSEKLAAGIYIYSIVADNKVIDSKRMIVSEK